MSPAKVVSTAFKGVNWWAVEKTLVVLFLGFVAVLGWEAKGALKRIDANTKAITELEKWSAATEANRFTSADGMKIQEQITILAANMPTAFPPTEWVNDVYRRDINVLSDSMAGLKDGVKEIDTVVREIQIDLSSRPRGGFRPPAGGDP